MIAVSIVTYHTPDLQLMGCLHSLANDLVGRVTVVDNSQSLHTREVVREFEGMEYIPSDNIGYGRAHNLAIEKSLAEGYDYHLVVNADVNFDPKTLTLLSQFLDANPTIAMAQPAMAHPDGHEIFAVRMLPTPFDLITRRFLPRGLFKRRRANYLLQNIDRTRVERVPYVQGSFMFMRCDALRHTGLFDPRYFMYPEDIDLSRRLDSDFSVAFLPQISVTHFHAAESYKSMKLLKVHMANMCRYFNKWGWICDPHRKEVNAKLLAGSYEFPSPVVMPESFNPENSNPL